MGIQVCIQQNTLIFALWNVFISEVFQQWHISLYCPQCSLSMLDTNDTPVLEANLVTGVLQMHSHCIYF